MSEIAVCLALSRGFLEGPIMSVQAGERVRVALGAARLALGRFLGSFSFRDRQEGHARLPDFEGTGSFIVDARANVQVALAQTAGQQPPSETTTTSRAGMLISRA